MFFHKAETVADPAAVSSWADTRREELRAEIHRLDEVLATANKEIGAFRRDYCAIGPGGRIVFKASTLGGGATLEVQWRALIAKRDSFIRGRWPILSELASLRK